MNSVRKFQPNAALMTANYDCVSLRVFFPANRSGSSKPTVYETLSWEAAALRRLCSERILETTTVLQHTWSPSQRQTDRQTETDGWTHKLIACDSIPALMAAPSIFYQFTYLFFCLHSEQPVQIWETLSLSHWLSGIIMLPFCIDHLQMLSCIVHIQ